MSLNSEQHKQAWILVLHLILERSNSLTPYQVIFFPLLIGDEIIINQLFIRVSYLDAL